MFKNMKIPVENNLDEIVKELERLGYKKCGDPSGYACGVETYAHGAFYVRYLSKRDLMYWGKTTNLAELKEM